MGCIGGGDGVPGGGVPGGGRGWMATISSLETLRGTFGLTAG